MAQIFPQLASTERQQRPFQVEAKAYRWLRNLEVDGLEVMHSLAPEPETPMVPRKPTTYT